MRLLCWEPLRRARTKSATRRCKEPLIGIRFAPNKNTFLHPQVCLGELEVLWPSTRRSEGMAKYRGVCEGDEVTFVANSEGIFVAGTLVAADPEALDKPGSVPDKPWPNGEIGVHLARVLLFQIVLKATYLFVQAPLHCPNGSKAFAAVPRRRLQVGSDLVLLKELGFGQLHHLDHYWFVVVSHRDRDVGKPLDEVNRARDNVVGRGATLLV